MRRVAVAVVVALIALIASSVALTSSSYGSGHHVTFSKFLDACVLSVPVPRGFHEGVWSVTGGGGIKISNRAKGAPPENPNQVTLWVGHPGFTHGPVVTPRKFPSHVTLDDLERASGGLPLWGGVFQVGSDVCTVSIWLGPDAKAADRLAILSALEATKKQSWVG